MMKNVLLTTTCVLFLTVIISGCSGRTGTSSDKSAMNRRLAKAVQAMYEGVELGSLAYTGEEYREREPNPNPYVGELLFRRYCGQCHGAGKAADIANHRITQSDPESDYYIIRYGYHEMPGFRNRLTRFQILDIQAYMNRNSQPVVSEPMSRNSGDALAETPSEKTENE